MITNISKNVGGTTNRDKLIASGKFPIKGFSGKKAKRVASGRGPLANKKQKYFLG